MHHMQSEEIQVCKTNVSQALGIMRSINWKESGARGGTTIQ